MTIKEIAELAGVSISTVSKIMNHKDTSISSETRERVIRIIKEFNYSPYSNTAASNTKTFLIGVLIRSSNINLVLNGIIETARSMGYTVLISESSNSITNELKGITALCRHRVDGVIWEPVCKDSLNYASSFAASKIPYLIFNSNDSEASYNIDHESMAYYATNSLIEAGHRDIGCLLSPGRRTEAFLKGYRRCLFDNGITLQDSNIFQDITDGLIHKITNHSISGIVNSHYAAALHLYGALNSLHYRIPYDVSLISLRDDARELSDFPRISAMTIPHFDFGCYLCQSLIQMTERDSLVTDFAAQKPEPYIFPMVLDHTASIDIPCLARNRHLIVVGSVNIDNYLKVDQLPATGKTIITSNAAQYPGGKAVNQAIGASKLGSRVAIIGNVGNDIDSDAIYAILEEHDIDSSGMQRCANESTGKAYIFVQKDGNSLISILSGANRLLSQEDISRNERLFENCSYCLVQTEVPEDAILTACKTAHRHDVKTILKPSAISVLDNQLLKYVDILVPNYDELCEICPGRDLHEQAGYFLDHGISTVIVTLGAEGCYLRTEQTEKHFPAFNFQTIDNTGSGDAFISALAVYLQNGYELEAAIQIASYAAAFSVTREGVTPSLVDRRTLEAYIGQTEPGLLERR